VTEPHISNPALARKAANRALAEGKAQLPAVAAEFIDGLAVHDSSAATVGWFVPLVTESSRLVGFVQLNGDLTFRRSSMFPSAPVVEATLWVDPDQVLATARTVMLDDDEVGTPEFSFHRSVDRVAWRVPVNRGGRAMTIYVAGTTAWVEPG
jgi:hypothetical protein